jgi:hypothetical protein
MGRWGDMGNQITTTLIVQTKAGAMNAIEVTKNQTERFM